MALKTQKVLILGGGFGGVKAALELAGHPDFEVTLMSDQENFSYHATLYQTATGGSQAASSIPLKEIFQGHKLKVVKDTAISLDRKLKTVKAKSGKAYSYDSLIVALGTITNYMGIKGLKKYAYGIKTLEDAQHLRNHLHQQLLDDQKPDPSYVVVGGGPTGVELAGALPHYIQNILQKHDVRDRNLHVDLIEAAPRLLPTMPKSYSHAVQKRLRRLGVRLHLGQAIQAESREAITIKGHAIASHSVIWTAGVTNNPFLKINKFPVNEHGLVSVDKHLLAEPSIYVIGDNAATPYSGMAQTALRDARFVASNLKRQSNSKTLLTYRPKKPVYITPVGNRWAAVLWGKVEIYGWLGWMLRRAADLVAYHDLEPWWKVSRHWLAESNDEKNCPLCGSNKSVN